MNLFTQEQKKIIALSSLGGALEFYDFASFAFLSKIISELFFPLKSTTTSLMAVFATFAVGYFARPLGAILFGHWGDRLGRKKTFVATVFLMAIPTFLIGCLPTYEQIGVSAAFLLILLRLLQGFSLGGEIPGAIVFIAETVNQERRGLAVGLILSGVTLGLLVGALVTSILLKLLPELAMQRWGWRIAFWLGGLLGIVSFYLRKRLQETPFFQALQQNQHFIPLPFKIVLLQFPKQSLQGFLIIAFGGTVVSLFYFYLPTYLATFFHFPLDKLMTLTTLNILLLTIPIVYFCYLSDQRGRKNIILGSILFFSLLSYVLFGLFQYNSWTLVIMVTLMVNIFCAPIVGCFPCVLAELFPTSVRYTGVALTYNFGVGIVGGLGPLLATVFISLTGNYLAPAFYLTLLAWLALFAMWFLPETYKRSLV